MSTPKKFKANTEGRDFVVGDIHGHYDVLMEMLEVRNFDFGKDRLFSCGDLVDRGPKNTMVLALIKEPWFHAVRGNHEDMMIEDQLFEAGWGWSRTYGKWIRREKYKSWGMTHRNMRALIKIAHDTLPVAIEVEGKDGTKYGIVHAGVPNLDWNSVLTDDKVATWDRQQLHDALRYITDQETPPNIANIDIVFHGHNALRITPLKIGNRVWLDGGMGVIDGGHIGIWEIDGQNPPRETF